MTNAPEDALADAGWPTDSATLGARSDRQFVAAYRRHSEAVLRDGFDPDVVHRMGRVEEALRERDIDPDEIVKELWNR